MIWLLVLIFIIVLICICSPYIDIYKDHDGKYHIVIWYTNHNDERRFINLI